MSVLLFGMWDCHCTTIAADVPARCPVHGKDLMAQPDAVDPAPGMPLGYESAANCSCLSHASVAS